MRPRATDRRPGRRPPAQSGRAPGRRAAQGRSLPPADAARPRPARPWPWQTTPSRRAAGPTQEQAMAFSGQVLDNPISGERFIFQQTAGDTDGRLLAFDLVLEPDGRVPGG